MTYAHRLPQGEKSHVQYGSFVLSAEVDVCLLLVTHVSLVSLMVIKMQTDVSRFDTSEKLHFGVFIVCSL